MTRSALAALTAVFILACAPSLALAKGPSEATIDGPGLAEPVSIPFDSQSSAAFWRIVDDIGFFQAVFRQAPDLTLSERPRGSLGPRYVMTYALPGPNSVEDVVRQDVYPYAKPRPVSYTEPGQPFYLDQETRGGWFVAKQSLKRRLVAAGLPESAPTGGGDGSIPWPAVVLLAALGALVVATLGFRLRRRSQPAPAA
jgi:hypothetical protein